VDKIVGGEVIEGLLDTFTFYPMGGLSLSPFVVSGTEGTVKAKIFTVQGSKLQSQI
jgi:hypothetical protein